MIAITPGLTFNDQFTSQKCPGSEWWHSLTRVPAQKPPAGSHSAWKVTKLKQSGLSLLFGQSLGSKPIYSAITIHYSLQWYPGCLSWDLLNPVKPSFSSCQNGEQSHNSPFAASQAVAMGMMLCSQFLGLLSCSSGRRSHFPEGRVPWIECCALTISQGSYGSLHLSDSSALTGPWFLNWK